MKYIFFPFQFVSTAGMEASYLFIRFDKRRKEEELEVVRRKVSCLRVQTEGSSIVEKLQQELREYREIVKCGICRERPKEVMFNPCFILWFLVSCVPFPKR